MVEFHFKAPPTEADVRKVSVGDSVYLDGIVFGVRDTNLIRVFDRLGNTSRCAAITRPQSPRPSSRQRCRSAGARSGFVRFGPPAKPR